MPKSLCRIIPKGKVVANQNNPFLPVAFFFSDFCASRSRCVLIKHTCSYWGHWIQCQCPDIMRHNKLVPPPSSWWHQISNMISFLAPHLLPLSKQRIFKSPWSQFLQSRKQTANFESKRHRIVLSSGLINPIHPIPIASYLHSCTAWQYSAAFLTSPCHVQIQL